MTKTETTVEPVNYNPKFMDRMFDKMNTIPTPVFVIGAVSGVAATLAFAFWYSDHTYKPMDEATELALIAAGKI